MSELQIDISSNLAKHLIQYFTSRDTNDMIEVTSLPTSGIIPTQLYKLSTDDKLYYRDTADTLWFPIEAPGWSRRDGTDDEEFESADANPPTGFTWDNQDSVADDENVTRKSYLTLVKSTNGAGLSVLHKPVPASPTNKTYMACLRFGSDYTSTNQQVGLSLRNTSNGKLLNFIIASVSGSVNFFVTRYTNSTTFSSTPYTSGIPNSINPLSTIIIAVTYDGTNFNFKYSPYFGGAESQLIQVYTETLAAFLTAFDQWGITIFNNNSTTNRALVDWLRVI